MNHRRQTSMAMIAILAALTLLAVVAIGALLVQQQAEARPFRYVAHDSVLVMIKE
jgi:hypothetical protein